MKIDDLNRDTWREKLELSSSSSVTESNVDRILAQEVEGSKGITRPKHLKRLKDFYGLTDGEFTDTFPVSMGSIESLDSNDCISGYDAVQFQLIRRNHGLSWENNFVWFDYVQGVYVQCNTCRSLVSAYNDMCKRKDKYELTESVLARVPREDREYHYNQRSRLTKSELDKFSDIIYPKDYVWNLKKGD